jgi:hypothetical protein
VVLDESICDTAERKRTSRSERFRSESPAVLKDEYRLC